MLKSVLIVGCLILAGLLSTFCGGGNGGADVSFSPRDVSSEYQGLSLEELKEKSSTTSYKELNDNIDSYKDKLVWFNGKIEKEFEGSTAGTYQIWALVTPPSEIVGWSDRMLILHSLERGPRLPAEAKVEFAGIVVGSHTGRIKRTYDGGGSPDSPVPLISVVKAAVVSESDR